MPHILNKKPAPHAHVKHGPTHHSITEYEPSFKANGNPGPIDADKGVQPWVSLAPMPKLWTSRPTNWPDLHPNATHIDIDVGQGVNGKGAH
eukprot:gene10236-biopygen8017